MLLKNLTLKTSYHRNRGDNVLDNLYIPCLKHSSKYNRMTGYFSPSSLSAAAEGMAHFISNKGKYRLIFSKYIFSHSDYESIKKGHLKDIENDLINDINLLKTQLKDRPRKILGWMIANNFLEIKICFKVPDDVLEHSKWGTFIDDENNIVHYGGSLNETHRGWTSKPEHTDVSCSWLSKDGLDKSNDYVEYFEDLWNNKLTDYCEVISFPDVPKERFLIDNDIKDESHCINESIELDKERKMEEDFEKQSQKSKEPTPHPYQQEAIDNWINNNYRGIFALATGLGKTFTSLFSLKEYAAINDNKYVCVIAVPTTSLIYQWNDEIKKILDKDALILRDESNWKTSLKEQLGYINNGFEDNVIILVTYNIYYKKYFTESIEGVDVNKVIICDEVHNAGSAQFQKGLINCYDARIALSATPKRHFDDDGTSLIVDYFNGVIIERDLEWGINNGLREGHTFLCPYYYYAEEIDLTDEELIEYRNITRTMMKYYDKNKLIQDDRFMRQANLRAKLIKNAQNKLKAFHNLINSDDFEFNGSFIFCGSNTFLNQIKNILNNNNLRYREFISDTDSESRKDILNKFKEKRLGGIVAIDCLDEGIDIPDANKAIILSSSSNSKQYIQRRGRVLRSSVDSNKIAQIYDFICIPPLNDDSTFIMEQSLVRKQLIRFEEFSNISLNANQNKKVIAKIKSDSQIEDNE